MRSYLVGRLIQTGPLILLLTVITFALFHAAPGDPLALLYGTNLTQGEQAAAREQWGLDKPLPVQYLAWLGNALHGDLGSSFSDGQPVTRVILSRLPATLELATAALVIAVALGVGGAAFVAFRNSGLVDSLALGVSTLVYSTPAFWLGLLLILVFSVWLGWLPSSGLQTPRGPSSLMDRVDHLVLPALVLSLREAATLFRYTRTSLLETRGQEFVRTARAKGLAPLRVLLGHQLRASLLPVITVLALLIPRLLGGAIVVESVFAWPGMGLLMLDASAQRNYGVLMGDVLIAGTSVILVNLFVDVAYAAADPRVRAAFGRTA